MIAGAVYAVPFLMVGGLLMLACEKPYLRTRADVEALDAAEAAAADKR